MSVLDNVLDNAKSAAGAAPAGVLMNELIEYLKSPELGGIQGLVKKFEKAGLGPTIHSWIGSGKQLPITPAEVTRVLGSDTISQMANKTGFSLNEVGQKLADILPATISRLTPGGRFPSLGSISELGGGLKEKVGL
ncbi:MAG TPA: YidB family protein [Gemmatimonadaceae bacterium]|nr:YidB family protein [Gemmatimonadaceae bacterium]